MPKAGPVQDMRMHLHYTEFIAYIELQTVNAGRPAGYSDRRPADRGF